MYIWLSRRSEMASLLDKFTDFYCSLYDYLWLYVQSACMLGLLPHNSSNLCRLCLWYVSPLTLNTKQTGVIIKPTMTLTSPWHFLLLLKSSLELAGSVEAFQNFYFNSYINHSHEASRCVHTLCVFKIVHIPLLVVWSPRSSVWCDVPPQEDVSRGKACDV